MKEQKEIISTINKLIETLKDGEEGFKEASEGVKDPKAGGTAAGALHRGWINLKSVVTDGDDHAILAECERGEDSAVEEYKKALDDDLSQPLNELLSRQYTDIKAAHDRVRSLRDTRKKS